MVIAYAVFSFAMLTLAFALVAIACEWMGHLWRKRKWTEHIPLDAWAEEQDI